MRPEPRREVAAPEDALVRYLDQLLHEVPEHGAPALPAAAPAEGGDPAVADETAAEPGAGAQIGIETGSGIEEGAGEPAPAAAVEPPLCEATTAAPETAFKSLLFDIDGMTLAAPLKELRSVIEWHDRITPVPGAGACMLGLLPYQGRHIKVLDAGPLLHGTSSTPRPRAYVVLCAGGEYGLACDAVHQLILVEPGAVRWRQGAGRRPWFAGVITERLCALLSVPELLHRLTTEINGVRLD